MFSMFLDISFSGSLKHMLAHFTESVVFVLELIGNGQASNVFETQKLDSMQLLKEILPGKKIEFASTEIELGSSTKKFSNQSRLKTEVSADFTVEQQHLYSKFRNGGASTSKAAMEKTGVINHPSTACSSFCKGKMILLASEAEQLSTRLKILEEENEILKQAFLERVVDRKKLINEICQLFQTLRYGLHRKDQEGGLLIIKPSMGQGGGMGASCLSQVLLENPRFR